MLSPQNIRIEIIIRQVAGEQKAVEAIVFYFLLILVLGDDQHGETEPGIEVQKAPAAAGQSRLDPGGNDVQDRLHRLGEFRRFLKPNRDILREWIANGRFALAGHLLEVQMKLELEQDDELAPVTPFLAAKDVAPLCKELAMACAAALHAGTLLESIADLACLRAILAGAPDAWGDDCREKMGETLAQPEMFDRFVWYCFGEAEPDVAVAGAAALVPDRKALRARVAERLRETDSLPDQIRHAYQIAESKL